MPTLYGDLPKYIKEKKKKMDVLYSIFFSFPFAWEKIYGEKKVTNG
jgi:hypothetical protein